MVTSSGEENTGFEEDPPPPAYGNDFVTIGALENYHQRKKSLDTGGGQVQVKHQGEARGQWDNPIEFLLSCISSSVGLGNIWRFPVTAYRNGGGAFLIPYFIVLAFIGRPMYFLELSLGQFTSYSQVQAWKCVPGFKGVGFGSMVACLCVTTYYCSVLALAIFYLVQSFSTNLPWAHCDESWAGVDNCNGTDIVPTLNKSTPEVYFERNVLKEYDNIDNGIGAPDWRLSLCLLFGWVFIYVSIMKGVKSSGKVAYFTALFPYAVLLILLIRGVTLPGAGEGILYFLTPQWDKLLDPSVWYEAVAQCFFSLNVGTGSIIMFSSYNGFKHNIYRDSVIVSICDTMTSFLAGIITFSILGNLKYELGAKTFDEVVKAGAGLAFISYPDVISKMDWVPQLFAVLFFTMLFTLGIGSATADTGAIASIFCDRYEHLKRWMVTGVVCVFGFFVGLIYVTPGGQWMTDLVDFFGGSFVIYAMSTLEVVGIAWIYGFNNFIDDIEFMLDTKLGWYWRICWGFIVPVGLIVILIYSLVASPTLQHNGEDYPTIAIVFGWLISAASLICLPLGIAHSMWRANDAGSLRGRFKAAFTPKSSWGPRGRKEKEEWIRFKQEKKFG